MCAFCFIVWRMGKNRVNTVYFLYCKDYEINASQVFWVTTEKTIFKEEMLIVSTSNIGQVAPIKPIYIEITINPR